MRAVILAGGKGVRLAPVTQVIPKPLVPLGGKPILEIVLRQLRAQGFSKVTLAIGYMAELIQAYFGDGSKLGLELDYSLETEPLGTAGPLALIPDLRDTFLVMNADILTDLKFQNLINYHRQRGGLATISAYERQVTIDLGVIVKDGDGRIANYLEKPSHTYLVSMGIYVFEPAILDFIREAAESKNNPAKTKGYLDIPDLIKHLLFKDQRVNYYPFQGYWMDIGRHDDYSQASEEFEQVKFKLGLAFPELPKQG